MRPSKVAFLLVLSQRRSWECVIADVTRFLPRGAVSCGVTFWQSEIAKETATVFLIYFHVMYFLLSKGNDDLRILV